MREFLKYVRGQKSEVVPMAMVNHGITWVDIQAYIYEETGEIVVECGVLANKITLL